MVLLAWLVGSCFFFYFYFFFFFFFFFLGFATCRSDHQIRVFPVPTEKQVSGSYLGPKADYEEMLAFCATHGVRPAIKTFPASEVNTALSELAANTLRYRAVLIFPAGESDE